MHCHENTCGEWIQSNITENDMGKAFQFIYNYVKTQKFQLITGNIFPPKL